VLLGLETKKENSLSQSQQGNDRQTANVNNRKAMEEVGSGDD
jgi:hypothetical protein